MKKVISLLSAFAVMLSMVTTVAFAADNEVVFTEKNKTENSVDIDLSANTTYSDIVSIAMYLDVSDVVGKGASVTVTNEKGQLNYVASQKMIAVVYKDTSNVAYTSGDVLGTITLTNISSDFSLSLKTSSARTTTKFSSTASGDVTSSFGTIGATITMKTTPSTPTATAGIDQPDGDKTFYTPEAVEFTGDSITVKVTNDKVTDTEIEETLEKAGSVLGGKTKLLPIIKYTPGDALKGSTFTIEIGDKTYTYAIAE